MQGGDVMHPFSRNSSSVRSQSPLWPGQQQQRRALNTQSDEPPIKAQLSAGLDSVGANKPVDDLLQVSSWGGYHHRVYHKHHDRIHHQMLM
jgi:hypothetical protein